MTSRSLSASRAQAAAARGRSLARLKDHRAFLLAELQTVNRAIAAIEAEPLPRSRANSEKSGTYRLLRQYVDTRTEPFTIGDALEYLLATGEWVTAAAEPRTAVATGLAHLVNWGELDRLDRPGIYRRRNTSVATTDT